MPEAASFILATTPNLRDEPLDSQASAPYADALVAYAERHRRRLHLPGHGGDTAGVTALTEFFGGRLAELDLMPMIRGIDLGPAPTALGRSLRLAAKAWGARRTWFLTNGASQGNHVASIALRSLGTDLLVQRSVHSSVVDAMVLTGANARFVLPQIDNTLGIAHGVTADDVRQELVRMRAGNAGPVAIYVVSPSYFGFISDIAAIAEVTHAEGIPLVVDEAWGSHLSLHDDLPTNALANGADLVISSTHKQAGSLTQSAMIHLGYGPFADQLEPLIERAHRAVQSTSESAVLLASLDLARRALVTRPALVRRSIDFADSLRDQVRSRGRFTIASDRFHEVPGWYANDPLKVVITTIDGGITGHEARSILDEEHDVLFELANESTLVAVIGAGSNHGAGNVLDLLHGLPSAHKPGARDSLIIPPGGPRRMSVREAFFAPTAIMPARSAIGAVSADTVAAYPPGIPNLLPGEEITSAAVEYLQAVAASPSGYVRGAYDPGVTELRVVRD
ncbi:aminotransferase class I/II-fold pyridoxal phosphate-dependent enzyme [Cryobacterium aureum]|uniref:aminotransferase class I/II-fold pyridoxal phosphate-dependent enzyme n=1 Tax=Cryobacterium aureum TaxID=995037 RepID=UPI000CF55DFA|nr:PLP-dependent transferase [Cryobacterium aureum]